MLFWYCNVKNLLDTYFISLRVFNFNKISWDLNEIIYDMGEWIFMTFCIFYSLLMAGNAHTCEDLFVHKNI